VVAELEVRRAAIAPVVAELRWAAAAIAVQRGLELGDLAGQHAAAF
jgi:hypothetical protein